MLKAVRVILLNLYNNQKSSKTTSFLTRLRTHLEVKMRTTLKKTKDASEQLCGEREFSHCPHTILPALGIH